MVPIMLEILEALDQHRYDQADAMESLHASVFPNDSKELEEVASVEILLAGVIINM